MNNFYVTDQTIAERTALLLDHARDLLFSGAIPEACVVFAEHRIKLIAEGYFLLNKAYKEWRMPDGHHTELPKIAALQCATIFRLQPFFPMDFPVNDPIVGIVKCNEIFACSYALGILGKSLYPTTPQKLDFWLRLLDMISQSTAETLTPYIEDKKLGINRHLDDYRHSIASVNERDKAGINGLICIFELISDKGRTLID